MLTRQDLNPAGCDTPNCGHDHAVLYLNSGCHTGKGTEVSYDKRTGAITVRCKMCHRLVAEILVAAGPT